MFPSKPQSGTQSTQIFPGALCESLVSLWKINLSLPPTTLTNQNIIGLKVRNPYKLL